MKRKRAMPEVTVNIDASEVLDEIPDEMLVEEMRERGLEKSFVLDFSEDIERVLRALHDGRYGEATEECERLAEWLSDPIAQEKSLRAIEAEWKKRTQQSARSAAESAAR